MIDNNKPVNQSNPEGILALIFGIASLCLFCCSPITGVLLSLSAIGIGIAALISKEAKTPATIGIILGCIGFGLSATTFAMICITRLICM